jgi:Uma2 family endonuclease
MSEALRDPYEWPYVPPVQYPESDGKPMAETDDHWRQIVLLRYGIEQLLRAREDAYVGSDLLIYYVEGENHKRVAPDVFAVLGVPRGKRRTYQVWQEGRTPDVVIEVTSKGTRDEDLGTKKGLYAYLGVREYFLVDPLGEYLKPALQGFRLGEQGYLPMLGERLHSEVLGFYIERFGGEARLFDDRTGEMLPTPEEAFERAEAEHQRAEAEHQRAEAEHQRAEAERQRAEAAEGELARLKAELERLRKG